MYRFPYVEKEGSLSINTSNRGGKKFTTWTFRPVGADSFDINIDILYPNDGKPLRFSATSPHLSKSYENTDIEKLRVDVETELLSSCSLFNNIVWEDWYEVVVSGNISNSHLGIKSDLNISYGMLKRGINPENGDAVTIHNNMVIIPFPKAKKSGVSNDKLGYSTSTDSEVSYIPVSPENTRVLEELTTKLHILKQEISTFLSQDNISKSIENFNPQILIN